MKEGILLVLWGIIILLKPLFNLNDLVWYSLIVLWSIVFPTSKRVNWKPIWRTLAVIMIIALVLWIDSVIGTNNYFYLGAAAFILAGVCLIFHSLLTKPRVGTEPKVALHSSEDEEYKVHTDE